MAGGELEVHELWWSVPARVCVLAAPADADRQGPQLRAFARGRWHDIDKGTGKADRWDAAGTGGTQHRRRPAEVAQPGRRRRHRDTVDEIDRPRLPAQ